MTDQSLMKADEYASLEMRYAHLQKEFADNGLATSSDNTARRAYYAKVHALLDAGFDLPKPGLYIVAAFTAAPRNFLQSFGRSAYYRNPRRYHALLPLLGETAKPRHPGHAGPGIWHRPHLQAS